MIAKMNCDEEKELCLEFHMQTFPSLAIFKKGKRDVMIKFHG